jgi:[acyl-carrier-protein] S-malonyltransferase
LMRPAAKAMEQALAEVTLRRPASPLVANVTASAIVDPPEIARRLVEQVTATVRWRESVAHMAARGVTRFYEIGAGRVLCGLIRRIADGATATAIGTPEEVEAFKASRG